MAWEGVGQWWKDTFEDLADFHLSVHASFVTAYEYVTVPTRRKKNEKLDDNVLQAAGSTEFPNRQKMDAMGKKEDSRRLKNSLKLLAQFGLSDTY